jgi:hypothetical protein
MGRAKDDELQGGGRPGRQRTFAGQRCQVLHHRDRQAGLQLGQFLPLRRGEFQCHGPVHEPGFVLVAEDPLQVPVDQGTDRVIGAVFCPCPAGHVGGKALERAGQQGDGERRQAVEEVVDAGRTGAGRPPDVLDPRAEQSAL